MKLFVAGLSYKTAPVQVRERLAIAPARLQCHSCRLKLAGLAELVLVSTCNRAEVYGVSSWVRGNLHHLFQLLSGSDFDFSPYLYVKEGTEAVRHLFGVASGLDSMVLGETEITGQLKQAYLAAKSLQFTGAITNRWFQAALHTAKRIRTETQIGRGATSVGSVAVELAERIFEGDLSQRTVMIIGAGKMGEACVRHLAKKGAKSVLVVNRSFERAARLASEFGGEGFSFDNCFQAMSRADIVVSSTGSPRTILHRPEVANLMRLRAGRPLFFVDIAVPRDIDEDVDQEENVFLYNVDHLEAIVRENARLRERALEACGLILRYEAEQLMKRLARSGVASQAGWSPSGMRSAELQPA